MYDKLPTELKENALFCLWRYEERNGKICVFSAPGTKGVDIYCEQLITRPSSAHNANRDSKNYYKTGG